MNYNQIKQTKKFYENKIKKLEENVKDIEKVFEFLKDKKEISREVVNDLKFDLIYKKQQIKNLREKLCIVDFID